jgi:LmbE family N-acetylglucosaminyl deacetylase
MQKMRVAHLGCSEEARSILVRLIFQSQVWIVFDSPSDGRRNAHPISLVVLMIVPLVLEDEWLAALEDVPIWAPPPMRLVVLAPHPDDETLGAGGFIAAQHHHRREIVIVAVTDGESAYGYDPDLGKTRESEQTNALAHLGVPAENIVRLRLPDSDVASYETQLVDQLLPFVTKDTHLVAPWRGDFHPDHEACGIAAEWVAHRAGARLTSYFFWTWHCGTTALLSELELHTFPLNQKHLQSKYEALQCHHSQLTHPSDEPILPDYLLAPARRPFEVFCVS